MNDQYFINEIKKVVKEVIPSGGQLFIYGSRARGDANEGSDCSLFSQLQTIRENCDHNCLCQTSEDETIELIKMYINTNR